ncbi:MAG TPA: cupin domain-containing protein [Steroidobacter sp.]|jgi:quercetin dioxygenase-like cupin family protein|nr:cupin domain-containing protein [Steroidobacter sp.]
MKMRHTMLLPLIAALHVSVVAYAGEPSASAPRKSETQSIKRTILRRVDVPNSKFEVVLVLVEAPANASAGKHTHPGTVIGYVMEGDYTMLIEGQPPRTLKRGESLEVPSRVPHDERAGVAPAKLLAVFTVEKGKPLATPVQ